jgi:hypothetical protein
VLKFTYYDLIKFILINYYLNINHDYKYFNFLYESLSKKFNKIYRIKKSYNKIFFKKSCTQISMSAIKKKMKRRQL